jgi:dihydrofolate reductase
VWRNSTAIGGYDAGRIRELKEQGDLYASGSATLVRALLADGLVDELHLYVYPSPSAPASGCSPRAPRRSSRCWVWRTSATGWPT